MFESKCTQVVWYKKVTKNMIESAAPLSKSLKAREKFMKRHKNGAH